MLNGRFPNTLGRRAFLGALFAPTALALADWKEFRGNGSSLISSQERLPLEWSDQNNLSWNTTTPGYGQSSPVIFDQYVFVTSVEGARKETLILSAFDLSDGRELWTHRAAPAQSIQDSDMISKAAPTPAADRAGVYAFFETGNLVALDHQGQLQWQRRLTDEFGAFGGRHGIGSSLRLCQAGVMALVAHDGPSYLICVDPRTGKTAWKTVRRKKVSWTTPAVTEHDGRELALVSGGDRVDAYDTKDGFTAVDPGGVRTGLRPVTHPHPGRSDHRFQQKGLDVGDPVRLGCFYKARDRLASLRGHLLFQLPLGAPLVRVYGQQSRRRLLPGPQDRPGSVASAAEGALLGLHHCRRRLHLLLRSRWNRRSL